MPRNSGISVRQGGEDVNALNRRLADLPAAAADKRAALERHVALLRGRLPGPTLETDDTF
jgi:hypothetical protein